MIAHTPYSLTIEDNLADIVRPVASLVTSVRVVERASRLDGPLAEAAIRMRGEPDTSGVTTAVRGLYRRIGIDPTKTRPSSEALLRRVRKGEELPRVNSLVDVINWTSLETRMPFGLYDHRRIEGHVTLRLGMAGESYPGIRKDEVHVAGRLVLADAMGPFGNPTSDSARTAVTTAATEILVVIFAPASLPPSIAAAAMALTGQRIATFASPVDPTVSREGS